MLRNLALVTVVGCVAALSSPAAAGNAAQTWSLPLVGSSAPLWSSATPVATGNRQAKGAADPLLPAGSGWAVAPPVAADAPLPRASKTLEELRRQFASVRDDELKGLRGGFAGLAFSVFFNGTVDSLGTQNGTLDVNVNAPAPTVTTTDTQVQIQTVIGNFQGASGIFQIASVPGNFNVVNNNLFVQLAIFEVMNANDIPALQSLLSSGFGN